MYTVNVVILGKDHKNHGFYAYFTDGKEVYRFVRYLKRKTSKKEIITRNIMIIVRWETENGVRTIYCT